MVGPREVGNCGVGRGEGDEEVILNLVQLDDVDEDDLLYKEGDDVGMILRF